MHEYSVTPQDWGCSTSFCPKCGTFIQENARYCANCGAPLSQPIDSAGTAPIYRRVRQITEIVAAEFQIEHTVLTGDTPTFIVSPPLNLAETAENLSSQLRSLALEARIRQRDTGIEIQVIEYPAERDAPRQFFGISLPVILLIATVITVSISGYLTVSDYISVLSVLGQIGAPETLGFLIGMTALYTVSIMAIVGFHELGHVFASRRNQVRSSLPLFIPGIPGSTPGTFGAVILQRTPTRNRNQLFDIGIAGPLVSFLIALLVSAVGYSLSLPLTRTQYNLVTTITGPSQPINLPLIFTLLGPYLLPRAPNTYVFFLNPLAYAGWIGTLITFLNVFPIGQLDGGHVARAVLGPKRFTIVSYIMLAVMFVTGWWTMALLVAAFMGMKHPGALNDVSPVSKGRKILALLLPVIFLSCFTLNS